MDRINTCIKNELSLYLRSSPCIYVIIWFWLWTVLCCDAAHSEAGTVLPVVLCTSAAAQHRPRRDPTELQQPTRSWSHLCHPAACHWLTFNNHGILCHWKEKQTLRSWKQQWRKKEKGWQERERRRGGWRRLRKRKAKKKKNRKKQDTPSTQEAFSHSTSCITHEVLTEECTHILHSLWLSLAGSLHKPGWTSCSGLSLSFVLFTLWHRSPRLEVMVMAQQGRREGERPSLQPWPAFELSAAVLLVVLVKPTVCSLPTAPEWVLCLDSLTDLNLNWGPWESAHCAYITPSQPLHPLFLSACLFCKAVLVRVSLHPSPLGISFLTFPLCFGASLFLSQSSFNSALSYSLMFPSLSLSLSFWDSIWALEAGEKTARGGVKTSMALFTKGPGIAQR